MHDAARLQGIALQPQAITIVIIGAIGQHVRDHDDSFSSEPTITTTNFTANVSLLVKLCMFRQRHMR